MKQPLRHWHNSRQPVGVPSVWTIVCLDDGFNCLGCFLPKDYAHASHAEKMMARIAFSSDKGPWKKHDGDLSGIWSMFVPKMTTQWGCWSSSQFSFIKSPLARWMPASVERQSHWQQSFSDFNRLTSPSLFIPFCSPPQCILRWEVHGIPSLVKLSQHVSSSVSVFWWVWFIELNVMLQV